MASANLRSLLQCQLRHNQKIIVLVAMTAVIAVDWYYNANYVRVYQHNSILTREMWVRELLNKHDERIKWSLEITKEAFMYIKKQLTNHSQLRCTRNMSSTEQLAIFLFAVRTDLPMRQLSERFQHSSETICHTYHKVMRHFLQPSLQNIFIKHLSGNDELSDYIHGNPLLYSYFKDAVGAIDGTHIDVCPSAEEKTSWRNRKGGVSQNVLVACDWNLQFTDVMVR